MKWIECLEDKIVRRTIKDTELSNSLKETAIDRIEQYAEKIELTDNNARFVLEEYYEAIIELIHALLSKHGFKCYNHECSVEFLREFYQEKLSESEIQFIHNLRKFRNKIKYAGKFVGKD